jgi:uncharacterized hydrophobic protein (TIGR00271 family)
LNPEQTGDLPRGAWAVLLHAAARVGIQPRAWKRWWDGLVRSVNHEDILSQSAADASFTFNYAFMVLIASGIATIGLIVNSPAVIIGAMLVSPLMGPIVSTGFAVAGFDVALGRRAGGTLVVGALMAIGFAAAISAFSPVNDLTSEILARTRPNLFDLAVAILSGAAGGYALIRGQGGAIVGVAIATALMPPLATVGFGLATQQWTVAQGALLLFVTNMVAIALSVAAVAVWYGFGQGEFRKRFAIQALITVLLLTPLIVPLSISLRSIAWESRVHRAVRTVLEEGARHLPQGQVAQIRIQYNGDKTPDIEAIVVCQRPQAGFSARMSANLQQALGVPVALRLTQLQADDPAVAKLAIKAARPVAAPLPVIPAMDAELRTEVPFPLAALQVDNARMQAVLIPQPQSAIGLSAWRDVESELVRRHVGWHILLVPPPAGLPAIQFANGQSKLDPAGEGRLKAIVWALERWGAKAVQLTGHASSTGRGPLSLAEQRVQTVSRWLLEHGVQVRGQAFYPAPMQSAREREVGELNYRSVEIALAPMADASATTPRP